MSIYEVTAEVLQLWPDPVSVSELSCALTLVCMGRVLNALKSEILRARDWSASTLDCTKAGAATKQALSYLMSPLSASAAH